MEVHVTGGSGAIGRFVVEELAERGHDVTVFDRRAPGADTEFVRGDVTDPDAVMRAVEDSDAVVHLAGLLPSDCTADPRAAERVNVGGTINVLEAAKDEGVRAICASSKAVFGTVTGKHAHARYEPVGEDYPTDPTDVYGANKEACERYCELYARDRGVDAICVRFASTYGPGKGARHGEFAVLTQLIEGAAQGDHIELSGGDQRDDFVYFADLAAGIAGLVEADALDYRTYHIGTGRAVSFHEFANAVADAFPGATIEVEDGLDFYGQDHPRYCRMDVSRIRADAGYESRYPPERAVKDYAARL